MQIQIITCEGSTYDIRMSANLTSPQGSYYHRTDVENGSAVRQQNEGRRRFALFISNSVGILVWSRQLIAAQPPYCATNLNTMYDDGFIGWQRGLAPADPFAAKNRSSRPRFELTEEAVYSPLYRSSLHCP
jgi:hypothetical protein